jgi:hypothetical protein
MVWSPFNPRSHMRRLSLSLTLTVMGAALAAFAVPASAATNPYSPQGVCGSGYSVVKQKRLTAFSNPKVHMATAYLLYSAATGNNCAVTIKRRAIGKPTYTKTILKKRGTGNPYDGITDRGWFRYYAGPVYVNAPGRCVRYGAVVSQPKGSRNLVFYRTFYSRWLACD